MSDSRIPLAPDDDEQRAVDLLAEPGQADQPYGLAAGLLGLVAALVANGLLPAWPYWHLVVTWDVALVVGAIAYFILVQARPRLPLVALCMLAATMGLLLSLPAYDVYVAPWQALDAFLTLFVRAVVAALTGLFIAHGLGVKRRPRVAIVTSFLAVFVAAGFLTIFR